MFQVNTEDELRGMHGLRVGSAGSSKGVRDGSHFFFGRIAHVAVYDRCLSQDRLRVHYLAAVNDCTADADRLYAMSASKFQDALRFAPNDRSVLQNYAASLCGCLTVELGGSEEFAARSVKRTLEAIESFKLLNIPDGIAQFLAHVPDGEKFADIVCQVSILQVLHRTAFIFLRRHFTLSNTSRPTSLDLRKLYRERPYCTFLAASSWTSRMHVQIDTLRQRAFTEKLS
jgi:hypothetical protein